MFVRQHGQAAEVADSALQLDPTLCSGGEPAKGQGARLHLRVLAGLQSRAAFTPGGWALRS